MTKPSICVVNDAFGKIGEGSPHRVLSIAKELTKLGFKVTLCCPFFAKPAIDYLRKPIYISRPKSYVYWHIANSAILTEKLLRAGRHDYILVELPDPVTKGSAAFIGKTLANKVFVDLGDLWYSEKTSSAHKAVSTSILKAVLSIADKVTVHHPSLHAKIAPLADKEVKVVPNGVDTEIFNPEKISTPPEAELFKGKAVVVFHGTISEYTGCTNIPKIANELVKKKKDVVFLIVGEGPYLDEFKQEVARRGLSNHFYFTGYVSQQKLVELLSVADVGIAPFSVREDTHTIMPLKVLEYLAMKKPVVSTPIHGVSELVIDGKTGFLTNPDEFSDALEELLNNPSLRKEMGEQGRKLIEQKFSWTKIVNNLVSFWLSG